MTIVLGTRSQRSLSQHLRLMLTHGGSRWEERTYATAQLTRLVQLPRDDLPFPTLPYLIDDNLCVVHAGPIERHLAAKFGLGGGDELQRVRADCVAEQSRELRWETVELCASNRYSELREGFLSRLSRRLAPFSTLLETSAWFAGPSLTYADFHVYVTLDVLNIIAPEHVGAYQRLKDFINRFQRLPAIAKYLEKERIDQPNASPTAPRPTIQPPSNVSTVKKDSTCKRPVNNDNDDVVVIGDESEKVPASVKSESSLVESSNSSSTTLSSASKPQKMATTDKPYWLYERLGLNDYHEYLRIYLQITSNESENLSRWSIVSYVGALELSIAALQSRPRLAQVLVVDVITRVFYLTLLTENTTLNEDEDDEETDCAVFEQLKRNGLIHTRNYYGQRVYMATHAVLSAVVRRDGLNIFYVMRSEKQLVFSRAHVLFMGTVLPQHQPPENNNNDVDDKNTGEAVQSRFYECQLCHLLFSSDAHIGHHLATCCHDCGAEFDNSLLLLNHYASAHSLWQPQLTRRRKGDNEIGFSCPFCQATFSRSAFLTAHVVAIHPTIFNQKPLLTRYAAACRLSPRCSRLTHFSYLDDVINNKIQHVCKYREKQESMSSNTRQSGRDLKSLLSLVLSPFDGSSLSKDEMAYLRSVFTCFLCNPVKAHMGEHALSSLSRHLSEHHGIQMEVCYKPDMDTCIATFKGKLIAGLKSNNNCETISTRMLWQFKADSMLLVDYDSETPRITKTTDEPLRHKDALVGETIFFGIKKAAVDHYCLKVVVKYREGLGTDKHYASIRAHFDPERRAIICTECNAMIAGSSHFFGQINAKREIVFKCKASLMAERKKEIISRNSEKVGSNEVQGNAEQRNNSGQMEGSDSNELSTVRANFQRVLGATVVNPTSTPKKRHRCQSGNAPCPKRFKPKPQYRVRRDRVLKSVKNLQDFSKVANVMSEVERRPLNYDVDYLETFLLTPISILLHRTNQRVATEFEAEL